MKILLLGATGRRTGRLVLDYALSQGHEILALVRSVEKIAVKCLKPEVVKI